MGSRTIAVELKGVTFLYGREPILQDIDLTIYEGEYIVVIGPNGGGKSTFLKLLLGLLEPTEGKISLFGRPPREVSHLVGYMPQNVHQNSDMPLRVLDIVLQGRLQRGKYRFTREDERVARESLEMVGVGGLAERKISTLSGGERQRTLLARALATQPRMVVLDEPTAAVDMEGQRQIYRLLHSLQMTRIVVSHDINILLEGVDRILYINRELVVHESIDLDLHPSGHFCEIDLLQELRCKHE
ncbi:MAG: ABC transporter ATP-binding protein [Epsilonproteobacteria bacterium]|nr:ABC transporter [Campylobacterota bacterium]NPA57499.1 ABC transporter ATP-binding protein [Campylobacterota bacterium]